MIHLVVRVANKRQLSYHGPIKNTVNTPPHGRYEGLSGAADSPLRPLQRSYISLNWLPTKKLLIWLFLSRIFSYFTKLRPTTIQS